MKRFLITLIIIPLFSLITVSGQGGTQKSDPAGKWKFEAPYAPEGFTTGIVEVGVAEKKYTATMAFTGTEYKFTGEGVKFEKDSLMFSIYIEGETIAVTLKMEEALKMSGKAVYSGGTVPLTLTREVKEAGK